VRLLSFTVNSCVPLKYAAIVLVLMVALKMSPVFEKTGLSSICVEHNGLAGNRVNMGSIDQLHR
jgi:hypothetical protein